VHFSDGSASKPTRRSRPLVSACFTGWLSTRKSSNTTSRPMPNSESAGVQRRRRDRKLLALGAIRDRHGYLASDQASFCAMLIPPMSRTMCAGFVADRLSASPAISYPDLHGGKNLYVYNIAKPTPDDLPNFEAVLRSTLIRALTATRFCSLSFFPLNTPSTDRPFGRISG